ncbi:hypothetical protein KP509_11G074300 [Ceratopteris richardii]|uniref:DUF659 domain-containing protein n=1 Tax=Ceratopteris richardii TaxID=49495 RepID=A0A8T2TW92_CERRI|nr:hypothetical protein KP509_11G074300 [Ceratopteris richardii]
MFLRSVDTSCEYKSGEYIFGILKDAILDVGPENVVQVCMDNATNCIKAGSLVEAEWPHIFFTRCTCHCLDLLFEDIGNITWIKSVLEDAQKVVVFVTSKPTILALFRKFSNKDLVKPAPTRFAYMFIMLSNMLDERVYNGLRSLMVSLEYIRKKVARTQKAEYVSNVILSAFFWRNVKEIVAICAPILKVLRLPDREGATMGLIYELTDRMVEEIKALCINRWNMLHSPLHAAAYVLHLIWREKCPDSDGEVNDGWMDVQDRYTNGDLKKQGALFDELDIYKSCSNTFSRPITMDPDRMQHPIKWWETFGANTPNLQKLAICAAPKKYGKLAYIHTNLRLASKIKERGFVKMEVTLDMIEKEKDDDRLLKLQDSIEEQGSLGARTMPSTSHTHEEEGSSIEAENPTHDEEDDDDDDDGYEEEEEEYVEEDDG